jgi:hypothetical protein
MAVWLVHHAALAQQRNRCFCRECLLTMRRASLVAFAQIVIYHDGIEKPGGSQHCGLVP